MSFPSIRPRRLRRSETMRNLVRETRVGADDLVMPLFVRPGSGVRIPIPSMQGCFQLSIDEAVKEAREARSLGIPAVLLFGIPPAKDARGTDAYAADGIIQRAVREIKEKTPGVLVITDVCLCEYTDHGHCGVLNRDARAMASGDAVDNDATLELLAKAALAQAEAGSDMVAPSAMMDGQVRSIRNALDGSGYSGVPIMAYSAKFASSFYKPFREAAESPPQFGDRRSYQMASANVAEAMREVSLDIAEGADIVMIKPALSYFDVIRRVRDSVDVPVAAYNVSGEYAMVKAAAAAGVLDEKQIVMEVLTGIRRAGADIVITYHAKDVARWIAEAAC